MKLKAEDCQVPFFHGTLVMVPLSIGLRIFSKRTFSVLNVVT